MRSAASLPKPARRGRAWLRSWHRWFGLGAALWLFLLAITGSAIVFYEELDRWLNPELRTISAPFTGTPRVADAVAKAGIALPGFAVRFVDLPNMPNETILLIGSAPRADGESLAVQMFADPRTGAIAGWRTSGTFALDRQRLMDTLYGLHMDLMLGETMAWFLGLVSLLWVVDHIPAAILAVPRLSGWRSAFVVKGRGLNLRRLFDLHRAPGLWLFPVTLALAVTGVSLTWHDEVRAALGLFSPVSHRLHEDWPAAKPSGGIGIDEALSIASRHTGARIDSVLVLPRQGSYGVRTFDPRDPDDIGRLWTYVRIADGGIAGQRHDNGASASDTFLAWQYPLHSGKAFGLAGRLLIFVAGLVVAALCVTGVILFVRRFPRRSSRIRQDDIANESQLS